MPVHPRDCPEFEYSEHPQKAQVLRASLTEALKAIRDSRSIDLLADTRPLHHILFRNLCPSGFEYFAGHYRGEDFRCLKHYGVRISSDPRVGTPAPLAALAVRASPNSAPSMARDMSLWASQMSPCWPL